jgi:branched-chain amino acid transport system substrate-binding protein
MMMKLNWIAAAVALTVSGVAGAQEVVKIGHAAPLSGQQAHYGKDNDNGARMAIADLNAKGVVINGKKVKFELVSEDDAADPKQGPVIAQKFCDMKVNGVVGHLNSGVTLPSSPVLNKCGIPQLTGAATNPSITQQGFKNFFRLIANDNAIGGGMAIFAAKTGSKNVAVIDDRTAYGKGVAEIFAQVAKKNGINVVAQEYTNDKATDFMAILTSIKAKKPDAIFFGGMDTQAGPMMRQMEQLGMENVRVFGGDGPCTEKVVELSGNAKTLQGFFCGDGGENIMKTKTGADWKKRYETAYPKEFQVYSPMVYDAVMVIADAMVRAKSTDPKVYIKELPKTNYKGVTGTISFDEIGELKNPGITISNFKSGKKTPLN